MKKILLTISVLGIAGLVLGVLLIPAPQKTLAQYAGGGTGQEVICKTGYRDWSLFISSTLGYAEFTEYWKDILVRYNANLCHYQDIDTLVRRLDTVRKQIRRAFYVCRDTTRLKETYYLLEAEIFYARNFIETDKGQFIVVNDARLRKKFKENFSKVYNTVQLDALLEEFGEKYSSKLEAYRNCKDPSWDELVRKWKEFKETAGGIGPALQEAREQAEERWDRMANTSMDLGRDFIGGFVDLKVNGLPVEEGLDQIMAELDENMPGGYTFEQLQTSKDYKLKLVDYAELEASYIINYYTLYKETSDEFTNSVMQRLYWLNDIIETTHPFENQTIRCVETIVNKQCP
jgi:hypothetical protein